MSENRGNYGGPFGANSGTRPPRPQRPSPTDPDQLGLRLLPGEKVLEASRRRSLAPVPELVDGLYLTNRRLIYAGRHRIWGLIPTGKDLKAVFFQDVTSGGILIRRLPFWFFLLGLLFFVGGIAGMSQNGSAVVLLLVGVVLVLLWLFLRAEVLSFAVKGDREAFEHSYFRFGSLDRTGMTEFLNRYFEVREGIVGEPGEHQPAGFTL